MMVAFSYMKSQFMGSYAVKPKFIGSYDVIPAMGVAGTEYVAHMNPSSLRRWMGFCERNWPSLLLGAAALATISYVRIQKVPFSQRFHLLRTENFERKRAEDHWEEFLAGNQEDLLPLSDPKSIRVQSIASNLISALKSGLRLEHDSKVNGYSCKNIDFGRPITSWAGDVGFKNHNDNHNAGFFNKRLTWNPSTRHLDGKNWEVYVLNSNKEKSACQLNGRIVIHSALVDSLKSDAELASVIAHEIGHVAARHRAEVKMRLLWGFNIVIDYPIRLPYDIETRYICYWRAAEADYIGLMLMALAGYDPRVAPKVVKKIGNTYDEPTAFISGSERAILLNKSKVMGAALSVYEKARLRL